MNLQEIIKSIIKEIILENDPKKGTGKKPKGSSRRLYTDENPSDTVSIKFKTKEDIVDTLNKESFKSKPHKRQSQIINLIHQRVRAAHQNAKDPEVKSRLKRALDYIEKRKEASKEKTERLNKLNEINLNTDNAVKINGDLFGGDFKVGDIEYTFSIKNTQNPFNDLGLFYNMQFDEKYNNKAFNEPTGNAKENYIKILSTMYKIIVDFAEKEKPKYIGISSLDKSKYTNIYNNLSKTNSIPNYSTKESGLEFTSEDGDKGKSIILKRNSEDNYSQKENLDPKTFKDKKSAIPYGSGYAPIKELVTATEVICDGCGWKWKIADGGKDPYLCHKCYHDNTPNLSKEEQLSALLEKNIPTDKSKWSYYKSQAKKKFDVYPSAYANAWAAKKYKKAGGGWRKSK